MAAISDWSSYSKARLQLPASDQIQPPPAIDSTDHKELFSDCCRVHQSPRRNHPDARYVIVPKPSQRLYSCRNKNSAMAETINGLLTARPTSGGEKLLGTAAAKALDQGVGRSDQGCAKHRGLCCVARFGLLTETFGECIQLALSFLSQFIR